MNKEGKGKKTLDEVSDSAKKDHILKARAILKLTDKMGLKVETFDQALVTLAEKSNKRRELTLKMAGDESDPIASAIYTLTGEICELEQILIFLLAK
jgi:hypothetical protein